MMHLSHRNDRIFNSAEADNLFIYHLNLLYCVRSHLSERFSAAVFQNHSIDFSDLLHTTLLQINRSITAIDAIYINLDLTYNFEQLADVIMLLENAFYKFERLNKSKDGNLYLFNYLQYISVMEHTAGELLCTMANKLKHNELNEQFHYAFKPALAGGNLLAKLAEKLYSS